MYTCTFRKIDLKLIESWRMSWQFRSVFNRTWSVFLSILIWLGVPKNSSYFPNNAGVFLNTLLPSGK